LLVVSKGETVTFSLWMMPRLLNEYTLQVLGEQSKPVPAFALIPTAASYFMAVGRSDGTIQVYEFLQGLKLCDPCLPYA
jgi:hypothetical protein